MPWQAWAWIALLSLVLILILFIWWHQPEEQQLTEPRPVLRVGISPSERHLASGGPLDGEMIETPRGCVEIWAPVPPPRLALSPRGLRWGAAHYRLIPDLGALIPGAKIWRLSTDGDA